MMREASVSKSGSVYLVNVESDREDRETYRDLLLFQIGFQLWPGGEDLQRHLREDTLGGWINGGKVAHHVGVGLAGHALCGVLVEELVDVGLGQPVSDLQVTNEEGESRSLRRVSWEDLVLEPHLETHTTNISVPPPHFSMP